MRTRGILALIFVALIMTGGSSGEQEKTYKNADIGFSVAYPASYQAKEIKWVKETTGVTLGKKEGSITVQAMPAGTSYEPMKFDDYVRIAAAAEIQNYEKLVSLEKFTSDYGVKGYKTFWRVVQHEDTDKGEINSTAVVGPIYYFPPVKKTKLGDQPVKTIMLSAYPTPQPGSAMEKELAEVAAGFRYHNSVRSFFGKGAHGKMDFVKKGQPFKIELAGNPTTGYNWYIDQIDEKYFQVISSGYQPAKDKRLVGAGGKCYWNIKPLKTGVSTLQLLYYRVWEGPGKAVDKFTVRVVVR